jgi:hypothetical protein
MTEHDVHEKIARATELVRSWPEWKRGILAQSARPMFSSPRVPVNNQNEQVKSSACDAVNDEADVDEVK